jgi:hypothetical protein
MEWTHVNWQDEGGVTVARVCGHSDTKHAGQHWPRVLLLSLPSADFRAFDDNPLKFVKEHELFPEAEEIQWMSYCAKPPLGVEIPTAVEGTDWMVVVTHTKPCVAVSAAVPKQTSQE